MALNVSTVVKNPQVVNCRLRQTRDTHVRPVEERKSYYEKVKASGVSDSSGITPSQAAIISKSSS